MNEANNRDSEFLGYEYKELSVEQSRVSMYLDGYKNFGWIADDNFDLPKAGSMVTLHLKRNRKIMNKMELTRLQRNFEACMNEIEPLARSKTANARIASLTAGVLGTAFMAGSTFAVVASPPIIWLCILLAVPGFSGWIAPYFLYKKLVQKRTAKVVPLIEAIYDEIYDLCLKGSALL